MPTQGRSLISISHNAVLSCMISRLHIKYAESIKQEGQIYSKLLWKITTNVVTFTLFFPSCTSVFYYHFQISGVHTAVIFTLKEKNKTEWGCDYDLNGYHQVEEETDFSVLYQRAELELLDKNALILKCFSIRRSFLKLALGSIGLYEDGRFLLTTII